MLIFNGLHAYCVAVDQYIGLQNRKGPIYCEIKRYRYLIAFNIGIVKKKAKSVQPINKFVFPGIFSK